MAAVVCAALPHDHLSVDLRTAFGRLYDDLLFADLYSPRSRPVALWLLACVLIRLYSASLTNGQAATAIQGCLDWQYILAWN